MSGNVVESVVLKKLSDLENLVAKCFELISKQNEKLEKQESFISNKKGVKNSDIRVKECVMNTLLPTLTDNNIDNMKKSKEMESPQNVASLQPNRITTRSYSTKLKENTNKNVNKQTDVIIDKSKVVTTQSEKDVEHEFIPVINKKNKKKQLTGTGDSAVEFGVVKKKVWLFISRVKPEVSAETVMNYLEKKIPNQEFICEKLDTRGVNSCFKVGADFSLKEKLEDPSIWPEGVLVSRYHFFRFNREINNNK